VSRAAQEFRKRDICCSEAIASSECCSPSADTHRSNTAPVRGKRSGENRPDAHDLENASTELLPETAREIGKALEATWT
jgi:hypothetical protein